MNGIFMYKLKIGDRVLVLKGVGKGQEATVVGMTSEVIKVKLDKKIGFVENRYLWRDSDEYEVIRNPSYRW